MIQIIVIKCTQPTYWYHNHIGEVFDVYDKHGEWCIRTNEDILFIDKDDAEIFDRKKKLERIKSKM